MTLCSFLQNYGIVTLHSNGTRTSTGNKTDTIGNNTFWSLPLSQTSVNISIAYCTFHLIPVLVQVAFPCNVTKPLGRQTKKKYFTSQPESPSETHSLTRMHSSRMRTAHSSSHQLGGLPQCMLGYPPCEPRDPPLCRPGDPPGCGPRDPSVVGLETPLWPDPQALPWVWAWKPARQAGIHPLETCKACWDTFTCPTPLTPMDRMTDMCKNITFANFVCGR